MLLILDLDETLIHATTQTSLGAHDFEACSYLVFKRPGLDLFLSEMSGHFQLAVWSSASDDYVQEIVRAIFPSELSLAFVWGRRKCTRRVLYDGYGQPLYDGRGFVAEEYVKLLKKVEKIGHDLNQALIVDDTPAKVANSYGNAVYVKPFMGEPDDQELAALAPYLISLKTEANVRNIEKRGWRNRFPQSP